MATLLNERIVSFNEVVLRNELAAAFIIQDQLDVLTDDLVRQYPSEETKNLQTEIHKSVEQVLRNLLQANSREAFLFQQKRLNQLIASIRTKFSLEGDLDKEVNYFRFYLQVLRILRGTTFANRKERDLALNNRFVNLAFSADWQSKLNRLVGIKDEQAFADYKSELMVEIMSIQSEGNLANLSAISDIEQNVQRLTETRLSYLKKEDDRMQLFLDLLWIGGGVALLAISVICTFVLPTLIIPALLIGVAALGYGVIDFLKANMSILRSINKVSLGRRLASAETIELIQDLEGKIPGLGEQSFLERLQLQDKQRSTEKTLLKVVGYCLATTGLFLALLGLIFAFPALGVPLAVIVVITTLSVALAVLTITVWGLKAIGEQVKLYAMQKEVNQQIQADNKLIIEAQLGERKIDLGELQKGVSQETGIVGEVPAAEEAKKAVELDTEIVKPSLFPREKETTANPEVVDEDSDSESISNG